MIWYPPQFLAALMKPWNAFLKNGIGFVLEKQTSKKKNTFYEITF